LKNNNKTEEQIAQIMNILHHPDQDKIKQYVQGKIREAMQEKATNLSAINNILTIIKDSLNVTTTELKNF
jgi:hypothetical protein